MLVPALGNPLRIPWAMLSGGREVIAESATGGANELRHLAELAASVRFGPIIDRNYAFKEILGAHRYVDAGRKAGSVVVTSAHRD